jgi:capsule polysaccharide export protein KpsC/LpsZ
MAALPNVKLVHPFTNSHELIPNAKAIVAINSSVGYEAIMYKRPVIAMGRSFYRDQGVTIDVDALYELEDAFQKIESFALTEADVLNFLWKIKYFSYESSGLHEKSESNAINIAEILSDFIQNIDN